MIQRKQTVFLLLALAAIIVCLCLPIGHVDGKAMDSGLVWYNFGVYTGNSFATQPLLFIDLVVTGALAFVDIFLYKRRSLQMTLCTACILLCLVWYGYYAFRAFGEFASLGSVHVGFAVCLPFVAIVFLFLARRGVKADEELIKSMDRIR